VDLIIVFLGGITLAVIFASVHFSSLIKVAIGLTLIAIGYFGILAIRFEPIGLHLGAFIIALAIISLAQLFLAPVALTFVATYGGAKFRGTLYGGIFALTYVCIAAVPKLNSIPILREFARYAGVAGISVLLTCVTLVIYFVLKRNAPKIDEPFSIEEPQLELDRKG
jgi:dipeptide/tripeptide permease